LLIIAETRAQNNAPLQGAPQQTVQQPPLQLQPLQQQPNQQQPGQPPAQPPAQQPPVTPQVPAGFQLNVLEQQQLDLVLQKWQQESGKITTFKCPFERWEYDIAFGPNNNQDPLNKNDGELSYHRPDKGSFEITKIKTFKEIPVPAGTPRKGDWIEQPTTIGDHWVCDGKSVYQYRPDLKQLIEHPIPPQLQGQAIVDGPLPFLFGADAAKLKQRYWMKLDQQQNRDPKQIWLIALPKFQAQAADFREIDVILDRDAMLPLYMQVWMPNGSHHMYRFMIDQATVNSVWEKLPKLFDRPPIPAGWKRVVENVPLQQAAQPVQPPPITK
jgi:TIGR03009 family protein